MRSASVCPDLSSARLRIAVLTVSDTRSLADDKSGQT
ncbi:molybdenum cofactor biosynthesis protein B, partial [Mesorhizobium sp. M4B.F.Ca.ET.013.02.1.1]